MSMFAVEGWESPEFSVLLEGQRWVTTNLTLELRMKYIVIVVLLISGSLMAGACSSSTPAEEKQAARGNTNVTSANSNVTAVTNGAEVQPPQNADANATTASSDELHRPGDSLNAKFDKMRKSGVSGPPANPAELARQNSRPAPENSTFTSYLTDAAFEVRTFNNHPQLLKVEKKITSDGKQTLKVFLRNGKVVDLPAQSISPIATTPTSVILQAAGVQPEQPSVPAGTAPGKKGE